MEKAILLPNLHTSTTTSKKPTQKNQPQDTSVKLGLAELCNLFGSVGTGLQNAQIYDQLWLLFWSRYLTHVKMCMVWTGPCIGFIESRTLFFMKYDDTSKIQQQL